MAEGGIGNQSPATLFQARLSTADNVGPTLTLGQYQGNKVVVNGVTVPVPQTGLTRNVGDNLISAVGADSGAPPVASTLYNVYISNSKASFSPSSIRLSATAPVLKNGVLYLGLSGNAANWRFVGWIRTNATPNFESSPTNRTIVNYYNRLLSNLFVCPNYVDDNANTEYAYNNAVWAEIAAGLSTVTFIGNGEDDVRYAMFAVPKNGATATQLGVSRDTPTSPTEQCLGLAGTQSLSTGNSYKPAVGVRTLSLVAAGAQTVFADFARNGAASDPFATFMEASLFV